MTPRHTTGRQRAYRLGLVTLGACIAASLISATPAAAFCGDFDFGTAPGFGSDSWGGKLALLGAIVAGVSIMPILAIYARAKDKATTPTGDAECTPS